MSQKICFNLDCEYYTTEWLPKILFYYAIQRKTQLCDWMNSKCQLRENTDGFSTSLSQSKFCAILLLIIINEVIDIIIRFVLDALHAFFLFK